MRKPFIKRIAHFLWAKHINRILFAERFISSVFVIII